jgi:hypothetical protein
MCDTGSTPELCFNMSTTFMSFGNAQAACRAMTGELVQYTSAGKQLMVEQVGELPVHCSCAHAWQHLQQPRES